MMLNKRAIGVATAVLIIVGTVFIFYTVTQNIGEKLQYERNMRILYSQDYYKDTLRNWFYNPDYLDCIRAVVESNIGDEGRHDYASASAGASVLSGDSDTVGVESAEYVIDGLYVDDQYTYCTPIYPGYCNITIDLGEKIGDKQDDGTVIWGIKEVVVNVSTTSGFCDFDIIPMDETGAELGSFGYTGVCQEIKQVFNPDPFVARYINLRGALSTPNEFRVTEVDAYKEEQEYVTCEGVTTDSYADSAISKVKEPFVSIHGEGNYVMYPTTRENEGRLYLGNRLVRINDLITSTPIFNRENPFDPILVKVGVRE